MADRIQARAIRRCGELLKQIEPDKGGYHRNYAHDGTDTSITRAEAAREAGPAGAGLPPWALASP